MRRPYLRTALITFFLLLALVALSGCIGTPDRLWLNAPDWSRAILLGSTRIGDPVPMALDGSGHLYFLLIDGEEGRNYPRLLALDRDGAIIWDRAYEEVAIARPDRPQLLWDGDQLQLFWLSDEQLYNAQIEPRTGLLKDWPVLISGEARAQDYAVALAPDGGVYIWFAGPRRAPGLYALAPGANQAVLVDPEGVRPRLAFDAVGDLHAIWAHLPPGLPDNRVFYAAYPEGQFRAQQAIEVAQPRAGTTSVVDGPWLMLDHERVYVFWTIEVRTGMSAGMVTTSYVHFPYGQPEKVEAPTTVRIPAAYALPYKDLPGGELQAGARVPLGLPQFGETGQVMNIATNTGAGREQVVGLRALLPYLMRNNEMQVGALFFRQGAPHSYQLLSFTRGDSRSPRIMSDAEGYLYFNWLERGDLPGFVVYFASTAPDLVSALSGLSQGDVGRLMASTLFGLLTGALLLPFALIWFIVPLIVIAVTALIRKDDEALSSWRVLLSLGLAVLGYWISKLALLPGMRDYAPFTAWIPIIPAWLQSLLRLATPLAITVLALWIAYWATYKRDRTSPLLFVLIFIVIDSVLTMAVYGVIIIGTN